MKMKSPDYTFDFTEVSVLAVKAPDLAVAFLDQFYRRLETALMEAYEAGMDLFEGDLEFNGTSHVSELRFLRPDEPSPKKKGTRYLTSRYSPEADRYLLEMRSRGRK